ncbi:MAG: hypothetical protein RIC14_05530 [Filomicrobium sp.]
MTVTAFTHTTELPTFLIVLVCIGFVVAIRTTDRHFNKIVRVADRALQKLENS